MKPHEKVYDVLLKQQTELKLNKLLMFYKLDFLPGGGMLTETSLICSLNGAGSLLPLALK